MNRVMSYLLSRGIREINILHVGSMFASKVVKHISPSENMIILKQITKLARIKKKLKKYVQLVIGSTKIKSPIKNTSTLI